MLEKHKLSHMLGKDSIIKSHPQSYDTILNKTNDIHLPTVHKSDNCILCCCVRQGSFKLCRVMVFCLSYINNNKKKLIIFADYKMNGIQFHLLIIIKTPVFHI